MAFDPELEQHIRAALDGLPWLGEKRMFGGLAWMVDGNMICAAITPGLMARVGKAQEAEALALPGVRPMGAGARRMGGWVLADEDAWRDEDVRRRLLSLTMAHVMSLPPKQA
ncbi:TfoX/Sxy family protein [Camelimonas sp. ID_303_24]